MNKRDHVVNANVAKHEDLKRFIIKNDEPITTWTEYKPFFCSSWFGCRDFHKLKMLLIDKNVRFFSYFSLYWVTEF